MLARANRVRHRDDFTRALRHGRRAGGEALTLALWRPEAASAQSDPPRVGFVVGKVVGGAVVRNRVRRRLRELARQRLSRLPAGSLLVVRAKPVAATYGYNTLARQFDHALDSALRPRTAGGRGAKPGRSEKRSGQRPGVTHE